jgi:fatty-acyl-CoA synthase
MAPALTRSEWPAERSSGVRDLSLPGLLREAVSAAPDRVALIDAVVDPAARREWTYTEFLADVERGARALLQRYRPGDRIAIWAPNSASWVILQQAVAMAGMVVVAANPAYRAHELEFMLRQSGAVALFHERVYRGADLGAIVESVRGAAPALRDLHLMDEFDAFLAEARDDTALPEVAPLDPVQIQYTSGTTGSPKGALLHHKGIVNEAYFVGERAGMQDGAVCINAMPMFHIGGGAVTELSTFGFHGTYVVMPGFDPGLTLELFETYRGTHALMVPTMLIAVLDHPDAATRDMSSVQTIMSGASAVPESLVRRVIERWSCQFSILFGQTEMHGVTNQTRVTDSPEDQASTVGQPLPELEMRLVDVDSGEIVALGEQGEICCRGYQVMLGYYELPEATAQTIDADGWLHMGDLGVMDERGFLKVTGRLKDMIIRGGMNLYPAEIEEVLVTHTAFADVAVLGVPDERWGEIVGAVVRLREATELPPLDELKVWVRERISAHKTPTAWYVTTEYPLTPSGKIQKFVLREQIADGTLVAVATVGETSSIPTID